MNTQNLKVIMDAMASIHTMELGSDDDPDMPELSSRYDDVIVQTTIRTTRVTAI